MRRLLLPVALLASLAAPVRADSTAYGHLHRIVDLSPAPEYRRAGTGGMDDVAAYSLDVLESAGYETAQLDFPFTRPAIDYFDPPSLTRISDGQHFKAEGVFRAGSGTVSCTVRPAAEVTPGDCGFIPFPDASPEWKNLPFVTASAGVSTIRSRGGVGFIIGGDTSRDAVFATSIRTELPGVVAVTHPSEIIGSTVELTSHASDAPATGHNVVGVLPGDSYVMLLAHADGWFQAASDNGSGPAAALRAAELLAADHPGIGVMVALTDAEEVGLIGAKKLRDDLIGGIQIGPHTVKLDQIRAVINLDASTARASDVQDTVEGVARTDAPLFSWRAMITTEHPALQAVFLARMAEQQVLGLPVHARVWTPALGWRTDAQYFAESGIPVAWPVTGYPEYHTDADTLATVLPSDLEGLAVGAAETVRDLAMLNLEAPSPFVAQPNPPAELLERFEAHRNHTH